MGGVGIAGIGNNHVRRPRVLPLLVRNTPRLTRSAEDATVVLSTFRRAAAVLVDTLIPR